MMIKLCVPCGQDTCLFLHFFVCSRRNKGKSMVSLRKEIKFDNVFNIAENLNGLEKITCSGAVSRKGTLQF